SPESRLLRPHELFKDMFADLRSCRFLAWRLFVRNMAAQHRQTVLGYLWLLLVPIVQTLLWVFLNAQKVINVGVTDIPYPAFVLTGTLLWQGFADAIMTPIQQIQASKQMLTKIHFPHEAIMLASLGQVLVNFGVRLILMVIVYLWFGIPLTTSLLLAPLGILALLAFGMMLGLLLTPLSLLYGDVQKMLVMGLSIWFFITPVIYPPPTAGWAALMAKLNPVSPLLVTTRQWLTGSELTQLGPFTVVVVATLILSLFGWVVYRLAMPHLIERIGS
ncbi:MAG: ABC transporter permease, partial [Desulfuromusa sp.]|nr:ABC transporter permease [Desulfuromusa sp.]